jgi:hypothetical protein
VGRGVIMGKVASTVGLPLLFGDRRLISFSVLFVG